MNENVITIVGRLGADPMLKSVHGDRLAEFRLGSTARRKEDAAWVDGHTNWYSVEAWGDFAQHVVASLRKGDLVVVVGRLIVEQWESGERRGTSVKIRADHVAPSLRSGAVAKDRSSSRSSTEPSPETASGGDGNREPVLQPAGQEAWAAPPAEPEPF